MRPDEERLDQAAARLGMTVTKLRSKVDGANGQWRYAVDESHVAIALPRGELRRLGIEPLDPADEISVAGIRCRPSLELIERAMAEYIVGQPLAVPLRADSKDDEEGYVPVADLIAELEARRDAIGLALLLRLLHCEIAPVSSLSTPREALLLDCIGRQVGA